jgi:trehalose 6-phosphate phosphatase
MTATPSEAERRREFLREARQDLRRTLVVLDVDGTVSAIAHSPDAARVERTIRETLDLLARRLPLWFVSGRDPDVARRMVGVQGAGYIGGHGFEVLDAQGLRPGVQVQEFRHEAQRLSAAVGADVPEAVPYIERKRWGVTFHYRELEEDTGARERLARSIEQHLTPLLRLQEAKMAFEVVPAVEHDKGTALEWLIDTVRPRRVLVAGDDVTDLALFGALRHRRDEGGIDGLIVAVTQAGETAREVIEAADVTVEGVWSFHDLLRELLPR